MASGRSVIAMVDGDSEVSRIVKEADCGIHVPPDSPDALAQALENLLDDKERCSQMGMNARTFAEKNFNKDDICRKYEDLLESVVR